MKKSDKTKIEKRFKALKDRNLAFYSVYSEPNVNKWFKELLDGPYESADLAMILLEQKDNEAKNDPENIMKSYYEARNAEYSKRGVTRDAIMEAQWEKIMENRPEKAEALQAIREEVKLLIPKPEL